MSSFKVIDDEIKNTTGIARFTVVGVGGGGGNAVEHMVTSGVNGVTFVCANTDKQALDLMSSGIKIQLGTSSSRGLGAGADPEKGKQAALEEKQSLSEVLKDSEMVFVTAGMGGGTGTGAAPVIADIAKSLGKLTVGVVTTPFKFEGGKRMRSAEAGIAELENHVDSLIVIPNENILSVYSDINMMEAFKKADDVLLIAVRSIFELVIKTGYINLDFADLTKAMGNKGYSMMGIGHASGDDRAKRAVEMAITSPLLDNVLMENAKGVIVNITVKDDIKPAEYTAISQIIGNITDIDEGDIFYGVVKDANQEEELHVTVIATGLERNQRNTQPQNNKVAAKPEQISLVPDLVAVDEEQSAISRRANSGQHTVTAAGSVEPVAMAEDVPPQKKALSVRDFLTNHQKK